MITDTTVLKPSPQTKHQSLGAGQPTVIISLASGYLYTANQTTQSFLEAVNGEKAFGEIVAELHEKYEVSVDKLSADLSKLAEKLIDEKLLTVIEGNRPRG